MQEIEKQDECIELKNIKYKTMLQNGKPLPDTKSQDNLLNLDSFLENEKKNRENDNWSKLNKTNQIKKINEFIVTYSEEQLFSSEEIQLLQLFLKDAIDKKKLKRVKDVLYDKTAEKITSIPGLHYNKPTKHFTLKNLDKRPSTLKSLPKKFNSTIKNKAIKQSEDDSSSDKD